MRKDSTTAKFTLLNMFGEHLLRNLTGRADLETERNKKISKVRYIVEQYFGISHLKDNAQRARFPQIDKNKFDGWYRQVYPVKFENHLTGAAYNIAKGLKIPKLAAV